MWGQVGSSGRPLRERSLRERSLRERFLRERSLHSLRIFSPHAAWTKSDAPHQQVVPEHPASILHPHVGWVKSDAPHQRVVPHLSRPQLRRCGYGGAASAPADRRIQRAEATLERTPWWRPKHGPYGAVLASSWSDHCCCARLDERVGRRQRHLAYCTTSGASICTDCAQSCRADASLDHHPLRYLVAHGRAVLYCTQPSCVRGASAAGGFHAEHIQQR